jgi:hypothetical protein
MAARFPRDTRVIGYAGMGICFVVAVAGLVKAVAGWLGW